MKKILFLLWASVLLLSCGNNNKRRLYADFAEHVGALNQYKELQAKFKNNQSIVRVQLSSEQLSQLKDRYVFTAYDAFLTKWKSTAHVHYSLFDLHQ